MIWSYVRATSVLIWLGMVEGFLVLADIYERYSGKWLQWSTVSTKLKVILGVTVLAVAQYRAYRDLRLKKEKDIQKLKNELDEAKRRPYDEEHRRLAEQKVDALSDAGKDLIYFLLHNGKTESEELRRHCLHDPEFNGAVQGGREQGLVLGTMEPIRRTIRTAVFLGNQSEVRDRSTGLIRTAERALL